MTDLMALGRKAKKAKYYMNSLDCETKNKALLKIADDIKADYESIIAANNIDIDNGIKKNMHEGLLDRLRLTKSRIDAMADGLVQITKLEDPIGRVLEERVLYNGLELKKISVPLGVIGIIYESRPNVTADAFGLTFKSGNAVILKGGSDAINSNIAIANRIRKSLDELNINPDVIQLIEDTDRSVTTEFMKMKEYVDVLIPRGGAGLIRSVVENSLIPVIETGTGNCHIYIDATANIEKAIDIVFNAKTQRIGVCNACESLVVHKDILEAFLPRLEERLKEKSVELHADKASAEYLENCIPACDEDYMTEYLDYKLSIKTVSSVTEAIEHINECSTHHSESIISETRENIELFLKEIDSACVYANASTRFSDGFEFGLGAEIGISTQRLHARGPMGLKELTTYKYTINGNGQVRG